MHGQGGGLEEKNILREKRCNPLSSQYFLFIGGTAKKTGPPLRPPKKILAPPPTNTQPPPGKKMIAPLVWYILNQLVDFYF